MFLNHFLLDDQKNFFPSIITLQAFISQSEENITCDLFDVPNFQMIKQKVYTLPENLDQLSNLNIGFVSAILVLIDLYSS